MVPDGLTVKWGHRPFLTVVKGRFKMTCETCGVSSPKKDTPGEASAWFIEHSDVALKPRGRRRA